MSKVWMTKYGPRRVRHDPPSLEEALNAAACMADDLEQRIEIAAALIGRPVDEVRAFATKSNARAQMRTSKIAIFPGRGATLRSVVVEHKKPRRMLARSTA
jgi:hypothetical protein